MSRKMRSRQRQSNDKDKDVEKHRQRHGETEDETKKKLMKGHVSNSNTQVCKVVPKVEEKSEDVELCHIEPEKVSK